MLSPYLQTGWPSLGIDMSSTRGPHDEIWETNFGQVEAFVHTPHGHCRQGTTFRRDKALGYWLHRQLNHPNLSTERQDRLAAIGAVTCVNVKGKFCPFCGKKGNATTRSAKCLTHGDSKAEELFDSLTGKLVSELAASTPTGLFLSL
ncbi:unknown protein [Seminavis robusta]|uniref:Helicase-associated domain-containing protein n=1 Tax=Seminavis robusta TaxID=568900 RepID=A0A9N8DSD1_9STRA|nr:unknown protein [Seminavis robusta]|eukprot:Sro245_g097591.1  (147) ;mRNA; f:83719-84159